MRARPARWPATTSWSEPIRSASTPTRRMRLRSRTPFATPSAPISPRAEARTPKRRSHQEDFMATQQIFSPLPGIFYRKPAPDKPDYKSDGDTITENDTICLIEVMKSFNEVKADAAG